MKVTSQIPSPSLQSLPSFVPMAPSAPHSTTDAFLSAREPASSKSASPDIFFEGFDEFALVQIVDLGGGLVAFGGTTANGVHRWVKAQRAEDGSFLAGSFRLMRPDGSEQKMDETDVGILSLALDRARIVQADGMRPWDALQLAKALSKSISAASIPPSPLTHGFDLSLMLECAGGDIEIYGTFASPFSDRDLGIGTRFESGDDGVKRFRYNDQPLNRAELEALVSQLQSAKEKGLQLETVNGPIGSTIPGGVDMLIEKATAQLNATSA